MTLPSEFWNELAPHHAVIENSYLDLPSLRRIVDRLVPPVLVVGAGQGLIVAELRRRAMACEGVDLSPEMIRYARIRRGLDLVQADARALPFAAGSYRTIICASGVVDFMREEEGIRGILREARRVAGDSGDVFVAFYRLSPATERFVVRLGLLKDHVLRHGEILEIYRLSPVQSIAWVARKAGDGNSRAALMALRSWAFSSWQEKRNALRMQRLFAQANLAESLIRAAPESQAYRNQAEIRNLFARLAIPVRRLEAFRSCFMAHL